MKMKYIFVAFVYININRFENKKLQMKKQIILLSILGITLFPSCNKSFKEVSFSGIENVKIKKMSQQGVEAEITAKIKNPNNVAFKIYPSIFDATLNGTNAGKALLTNKTKIKANSEETYSFTIKSDFSKLSLADMPNLLAMAMSRNAKIGLKGNLKVGRLFYKRSFPVELTKSVPLGTN